MTITVYAFNGAYLGKARSFGEARRMQEESLPDDLKECYAGIQDGYPLFYHEKITKELEDKYVTLQTYD